MREVVELFVQKTWRFLPKAGDFEIPKKIGPQAIPPPDQSVPSTDVLPGTSDLYVT